MNTLDLLKMLIICFTFSTLIFYNCSNVKELPCFESETKETNVNQVELDNAEYRSLLNENHNEIKALKKQLAINTKEKTKKKKERKRLFAENYKKYALENEELFGIPYEITLGQAILESDCGKSTLAKNGNNFFGIKCGSKLCSHVNKCIEKETWEDTPSGIIKKIANFRVYDSIEDGFFAHGVFLQKDRYKPLQAFKMDYKKWAYGLKRKGYATDKKYPDKLINIIEKYIR